MMRIRKIIRNRYSNNRGFTLIEVIAVLVILSIIAAVIISRGMSTAEVNLKAQTEVLKSHIRYAQFRNMNMKSATALCNASFGISIDTGLNSYSMFKDCVEADTVILPGADSDTVSLPNVNLSSSSAFITFDDWGVPCTDSSGTTLATSDITITLSSAGAPNETITITKNTGFVQ
ncbi:MAG: type II secretion system protein [Pseudomonadota bacterium]